MADYPRQLYLDAEREEALISYIETELVNHDAERGAHIDDLKRWQKDYWAKPTTERATFPFTGAATIVIPLTAIAVEAVHARTMTTMFALPQFVSAHALSTDWDKASRPVERFMDRELLQEMKIRKPLGDCFLEAEKYGTMIGKTGYEKVVKTAIRTVGDVDEEFDVVVREGATFDAVSDARFLMPHSAKDPQTSPWCGEEHTASSYEVMLMESAGLFREGTIIDLPGDENNSENWSKLRAWVNATADMGFSKGKEFDTQQAELENTKPAFPNTIDWVEFWCSFDVDSSRSPKEICVHYHRASRTLMSIRYNWHSDLRRPYRTGVYFPVEHRWRGIGICKKNEQFQREVTTQHRQRLDNATLANMRMIKISKLSGYGPREPIFPGKMWFVDDMTHVETFQLGEIYPSSYQNEQATAIYSQQRTGVNETNLGMPQVGTPGTATSDLARIQEGNKKFDFVYANHKDFSNEIIMDIAENIQQFGPRRIAYYDQAEGGDLVKQFFQMPVGFIRDGLLINLKAAGQQQNKIIDRQNWQQIAAMLQQYYQGLVDLAMPLGDQQLLQTIFYKGMGAATEAMRQIFESFDIRNIDRMIVRELEDKIHAGLADAGGGAISGGANGSQGAIAAPRMDMFAALNQTQGGNGNGTANRLLNAG
jgi:hypothetical protein